MSELQMFFRVSSELHAAVRIGDDETKSDALMEIVGIWLHAENARVRARCAALLDQHGLAGEMDRLCEQWAS